MNNVSDNELYQKHLATIWGVKPLDELTNNEVEDAFDTLLHILPNNGKLYKYRSFEKEKFDWYYDALENGYLWFSQAEKLNDDFDTVLYFDTAIEAENIKNFLLQNPILYFKAVINMSDEPLLQFYNDLDRTAFYKVLDCYDLNSGKLDINTGIKLLSKLGVSNKRAIRFINEIDEFIKNYIAKNEKAINEAVNNLVNINKTMRKISFIYSMSETYQSNPMWAFYSDNNQGFCIEYDFNKAKDFDIDKKRKLLTDI